MQESVIHELIDINLDQLQSYATMKVDEVQGSTRILIETNYYVLDIVWLDNLDM